MLHLDALILGSIRLGELRIQTAAHVSEMVLQLKDPLVLLGYTQRRRDMSPQDEAEFFTLVRKAGMKAVLVPPDRIPHGETYMLTTLFELRWEN